MADNEKSLWDKIKDSFDGKNPKSIPSRVSNSQAGERSKPTVGSFIDDLFAPAKKKEPVTKGYIAPPTEQEPEIWETHNFHQLEDFINSQSHNVPDKYKNFYNRIVAGEKVTKPELDTIIGELERELPSLEKPGQSWDRNKQKNNATATPTKPKAPEAKVELPATDTSKKESKPKPQVAKATPSNRTALDPFLVAKPSERLDELLKSSIFKQAVADVDALDQMDVDPNQLEIGDEQPVFRNEKLANEVIDKVHDSVINQNRMNLGPALTFASDWTDSKYDLANHYKAPDSNDEMLLKMMALRDNALNHRNQAEITRMDKLTKLFAARQKPAIEKLKALTSLAGRNDASTTALVLGSARDAQSNDALNKLIEQFNAKAENDAREAETRRTHDAWRLAQKHKNTLEIEALRAKARMEYADKIATIKQTKAPGTGQLLKMVQYQMERAYGMAFNERFMDPDVLEKANDPEAAKIIRQRAAALDAFAFDIALEGNNGSSPEPYQVSAAYQELQGLLRNPTQRPAVMHKINEFMGMPPVQ
jgi:hypothetical protein